MEFGCCFQCLNMTLISRQCSPDFHEQREQQFSPAPDLPWPGLQSDWKIMAAELFPTKKLVPSSTTSIQQYQQQNLTNNNTTAAHGCCNWQGLYPTIRERSVWTRFQPVEAHRDWWCQLDVVCFNKDSRDSRPGPGLYRYRFCTVSLDFCLENCTSHNLQSTVLKYNMTYLYFTY